MKTCTKCGERKPIDQFPKDSTKSDGRHPRCKACRSVASRDNYLDRKSRKKKIPSSKKCTQCFKTKESKEFNKNPGSSDGISHWCKSCHFSYVVEWRKRTKMDRIKKGREYETRNREKISARKAEYYLKNRERILSRNLEWERRTLKDNPVFALRKSLRCRTSEAFRKMGYKKGAKTEQLLGGSWGKVKAHIEKQFRPGMTWENRGEWHVDHIVPLSSAKTESELIALCHYTNLQPLWAEDNLRKGARLDWDD